MPISAIASEIVSNRFFAFVRSAPSAAIFVLSASLNLL